MHAGKGMRKGKRGDTHMKKKELEESSRNGRGRENGRKIG